jgi:hypothetical protein
VLNSSGYQTLLDTAFTSAFTMIDDAINMIGNLPSPGAPPGAQWSFPDSEARDLAARIFGAGASHEVPDIAARYTLIKSIGNGCERLTNIKLTTTQIISSI